MSDENLKPLSFDDEEVLKPISFDTSNNTPTDFVPLANANTNEIKNKDSNFVFFFGVSASGKSVILSAILYYLRSKAGVLRPKLGTPNTKEAQVLLADFFENIRDYISNGSFIFLGLYLFFAYIFVFLIIKIIIKTLLERKVK